MYYLSTYLFHVNEMANEHHQISISDCVFVYAFLFFSLDHEHRLRNKHANESNWIEREKKAFEKVETLHAIHNLASMILASRQCQWNIIQQNAPSTHGTILNQQQQQQHNVAWTVSICFVVLHKKTAMKETRVRKNVSIHSFPVSVCVLVSSAFLPTTSKPLICVY